MKEAGDEHSVAKFAGMSPSVIISNHCPLGYVLSFRLKLHLYKLSQVLIKSIPCHALIEAWIRGFRTCNKRYVNVAVLSLLILILTISQP
jgi:hypothetical protein